MDCYDISLLQCCVYYDVTSPLSSASSWNTGSFTQAGKRQSRANGWFPKHSALHWTSLRLVCISTICEKKGVKKYKKSDWLVREKDFEGLRRGAKIVRSAKHTALREGPSSGSNETSFTAPFAALALIYFHWKRQTRHSNSLSNKQEKTSSESIVMICNPWANSNEADAMVT